MTRNPTLAQPSTRLSTAMLESLVANIGFNSPVDDASFAARRAQNSMMRIATAVFPVPIGDEMLDIH